MTLIREIFSSIQGEGLCIGEPQVFVRFCGCNLKCKYCDTDFDELYARECSDVSFLDEISKYLPKTISLTGGEPLLSVDFLLSVLPKLKKSGRKIYLETNGTLVNELERVIDFVDIVAMDIKVKSATGQKNRFEDNKSFLNVAAEHNKKAFIKVVYTPKIEFEEIVEIIRIAREFNTAIVLQPAMPLETGFESVFDKFYGLYKNVRLIPQTHKFLGLP